MAKKKELTEEELLKVQEEKQQELDIDTALGEKIKLDKTTIELLKNTDISKAEMRALIDSYYQTQNKRIAVQGQIRAIEQGVDTNTVGFAAILNWNLRSLLNEEDGIKKALQVAVERSNVGQWVSKVMGLGPVLSATCLAYFDIDRSSCAGSFIQYAGLNDNNRPWLGKVKSEDIVNKVVGKSKEITNEHLVEISEITGWKTSYLINKSLSFSKAKTPKITKENLIKACSMVPHNKELKTQCWKIGQQFIKLRNNPKSLYGRLLTERLTEEIAKNDAGLYTEQAEHIITTMNFDKTTDTYKCYAEGKLPKGHLMARAQRWATKIFVCHLYEEMYWDKYKSEPPKFYSLVFLGHTHPILPEVPYIY
jgi:hypothetical protein